MGGRVGATPSPDIQCSCAAFRWEETWVEIKRVMLIFNMLTR